MKTLFPKILACAILLSIFLTACQANAPAQAGKKTIVVTYSILGAVVKDLVGDRANVVVPMPNGQDPHEWEPSAKDIETLTQADVIVQNGLGLEGGMQKALAQAKEAGVKFFTASDHITVRHVGAGEGIPSGDPDQAVGAEDPHLWMDPVDMISIVDALAAQIKTELGIDLSDRAKDLDTRLDSLIQEVTHLVAAIPAENRKLVTGHESMGYYAQRFGFKLVGAIIPSISTQSEVSASDLAALKKLIEENQVKAIFTELGIPKAVSDAIGRETGVQVIELTTHSLPEDGSYFTFMRNLTTVIVKGLKMSFLFDPFFSNTFLLRALIAGILVSISCGIVGTFVVLRGLAFIGDALAHGVLPGIAVAILLGIPGIIGAAVGALVMVGGISLITRRSQLSSDTAIGLLFVGMLALGVVIVSRSTSFTGDIVQILFGEILGISSQAVIVQALATLVIAIAAVICSRPFLLLCFNPEQAQVAGFSPRIYHNVMLAMIALAVIVSFQTVGTLLVFGMLLAPAGAGALLARRVEAMMAWAALIGSVSVYIGLLASYYYNLAAGSAIVLVAVLLFFGVLIVKNLRMGHNPSAGAPVHE